MSAIAAPQRGQRVSFLALHTRKVLAASGFVLLGFVILHLGGNLLAFAGSGTFDAYARSIRELGGPLVGEGVLLVVARVVLATALALHLLAHAYLVQQPSEGQVSAAYVADPPWFATLPLAVLQASGGVIALFLALHIAQLTIGAFDPAFVVDDPHHNMVVALRFWPVAITYIAAAIAVGVHLLPGTWTGMASLGLIRPRTERLTRRLSPAVALVVAVGMASVPAAVLFGVLT